MRARNVLSIAALTLAASGLAACGTHEAGTGSPAKPTSHTSSPVAQQPSSVVPTSDRKPVVVRLPGGPGRVRLVVGQQLTVHFNTGTTVQPSQSNCAKNPATGGVLRQLCGSDGDYRYQAVAPGSSSMVFTIKPKCSAGAVCPDWVQQAHFSVSVSKS
jgi:hypothetical protein